ncbi:MAG TPA: DUF4292 domain-containing protein [Flavobacterium sp.]|nr:DUF4292 domain-containing protein [Flavobacterium sp.]
MLFLKNWDISKKHPSIKSIALAVFLVLFISSCKTTKQAVTVANNTNNSKSVNEIIKGHQDNFKDFLTLNIKASIKYEDVKNKQNVNADIRIKKDEIIWINVKVFGISVAKAYITPTKVSYYEIINATYFDGDYALISNWLGTNLDFQKIQNLLLGKAMGDINSEKFMISFIDNLCLVSEKNIEAISKQYTFDNTSFLLKQTVINQIAKNRTLDIKYLSHELFENQYFPKNMSIKAIQEKQISIDITYNKIELNQTAPFPFSIPSGYEQIEIKNKLQ